MGIRLYSTKNSATGALKTTSKRAIQKAAELTGYLVGKNIARAASKSTDEDCKQIDGTCTSRRNISWNTTTKCQKKDTYHQKEHQQITDELRSL